jgi:hypothetical protein
MFKLLGIQRMEVEDYSDRAFAIFGDTDRWEDDLRALNARKNRNLGGRPGFIISKRHETALMDFVTRANNGAIEPGTLEPPAPSTERVRRSPPLNPSNALDQLRATAAAMGMPPPSPAMPASSHSAEVRTRVSKRVPAGPRPVRALPSTRSTLTCPTLFVAADGLAYQVAIYTAPLPSVGQRVTLEIGDTRLEYTITLTQC